MLTVGNRQFKTLEKYAQKYQIYQGQYEVEQKNSMDADEQEQVQDNGDPDGGSLSEDVTVMRLESYRSSAAFYMIWRRSSS